jgi:threonine 3-dehydrogenase
VATTMNALVYDRNDLPWESSTGLLKRQVPLPELDRASSDVLVRVTYAGFCGSDRGIWYRKAFGDLIHSSLDTEKGDVRVVGHEFIGEIIEVGARAAEKYGYKVGQTVSTESHIVCGACWQCRHRQSHVCVREKIIGISQDGCFADVIRLPAHALWPTDLTRIRPEVAAVQEPFGNAVHACQVADLRGKRVAVFGTGTIGLFAVLIARGMGATHVIGVEPNPHQKSLAMKLGCDEVLHPGPTNPDQPWAANPELVAKLHSLTRGNGVDVTMEMSGVPSSLNAAIQSTRRGGDVVLFGVRNGDVVIQDAHRIVMNGLNLHGVVGRRIFDTWNITRGLLEATDNGIQQAVYETILNSGDGPVMGIDEWTPEGFETVISKWPKPLIRFS